MTKNDQMRRLIEAVVRKELSEILPVIVPQVIKEVMSGLLMEQVVTSEATEFRGNSNKRKNMFEQTSRNQRQDRDDEYEEDVAPRSRRRLPSFDSDSDEMLAERYTPPTRRRNIDNLNLPSKMLTESGNAIDIDPSAVPDFIVNAMNKDYSGFMKNLASVKNSSGVVSSE